ncbi:hypothetical protein Goklo_029126 [Gossypium klotzschianum]|uniref:Aminotransferase-like plant mobile domain-containing protein n=1 Tax=Gossypium klotzschianum TaxID=34286 RepID=A0A7J8W9J6_9ROSI|nr:hypothetical protein [Gossypium klotzschianum]
MILEICGHLQKVGLLHVSRMTRGGKLDLTLIMSTITLKDVALQLNLLVDGPVITRSVVIPSKVDICRALLGKVPDKFEGGQISINWLEDNFNELPKDPMEEVIEQYTQTFIMRWNHELSYVGLSEELEDFSLLLDQQSKAKFEWMSYADIDIIYCILSERFRWRQRISSPSRDLKELHKVDMQGNSDDDWTERYGEHIKKGRQSHNKIIIGPDRGSVACVYAIYGYIFPCTDVLHMLHPHIDIDADPDVGLDARPCTTTDEDTGVDAHIAIDVDVDAYAAVDADVDAHAVVDANEAKTTQQSTTEDDDDAGELKEEGHEALVGGSPNDDDAEEEVYRPAPPDVHPVAPLTLHKILHATVAHHLAAHILFDNMIDVFSKFFDVNI